MTDCQHEDHLDNIEDQGMRRQVQLTCKHCGRQRTVNTLKTVDEIKAEVAEAVA